MSEPQNKFVTVNATKLHYLDWGNIDAPPLLLLHGLCGNAHYWDFFARNLVNKYHIIALDQRGHGNSDRAASYGPRDYVADLEAFVERLQLTDIHLIGHSMGGINAILFAQRNPLLVTKLIIVDIGPEIGESGAVRLRDELTNEPESFSSIEDAFRHMRPFELYCSDDFLQYQLTHGLMQDASGKFVFKFDKALRQTEMRSPIWLLDYLGGIVCPTVILHGIESDILIPETAQRMEMLLPFGSVIDIESAGHGIVGDNPDAFENAVRNFLITDTT